MVIIVMMIFAIIALIETITVVIIQSVCLTDCGSVFIFSELVHVCLLLINPFIYVHNIE